MRRTALYHAAASALAFMLLTTGIVALPGVGARTAVAQERARRSWLGIAMREDKTAGHVFVRSVVRSSPAEKAGLRIGDLIVWVAGRTVRQPSDVVGAVSSLPPGTAAQLIVERGGKRETITARVEQMPSAEDMTRMELVGKAAPAWVGLRSGADKPGPALESYRGRVVVLDFWASWCTACGFTARHLNEWNAKYRARGLVVLGLAPESPELLDAAARRLGIRYATAADPGMATTESYRVQELPTVVVIDRRGVVRDVGTGYAPSRIVELEALVARLLAEEP